MNTVYREDTKAIIVIGIVIVVTLLIITVAISSIYQNLSPTEAWGQSTNLQADLARMIKKK